MGFSVIILAISCFAVSQVAAIGDLKNGNSQSKIQLTRPTIPENPSLKSMQESLRAAHANLQANQILGSEIVDKTHANQAQIQPHHSQDILDKGSNRDNSQFQSTPRDSFPSTTISSLSSGNIDINDEQSYQKQQNINREAPPSQGMYNSKSQFLNQQRFVDNKQHNSETQQLYNPRQQFPADQQQYSSPRQQHIFPARQNSPSQQQFYNRRQQAETQPQFYDPSYQQEQHFNAGQQSGVQQQQVFNTRKQSQEQQLFNADQQSVNQQQQIFNAGQQSVEQPQQIFNAGQNLHGEQQFNNARQQSYEQQQQMFIDGQQQKMYSNMQTMDINGQNINLNQQFQGLSLHQSQIRSERPLILSQNTLSQMNSKGARKDVQLSAFDNREHGLVLPRGSSVQSSSVIVSGLKNLPVLPAMVYNAGPVPATHAIAFGRDGYYKGRASLNQQLRTPYVRYVYSHIL